MQKLAVIIAVAVLTMVPAAVAVEGKAAQTPAPTRWIYCFAGIGSQDVPVEYFSRIFGIGSGDNQSAASYLPKFNDYLVKTYEEDGKRLVGACSPSKTMEEAATEMESSKKNFSGYRIVDANWP
jgi:hypothetical protein